MDWDKLRVFHAVAEAGSFTHAGDTLNLSQSAVSRQISHLEESLRVPLFHRHARGLLQRASAPPARAQGVETSLWISIHFPLQDCANNELPAVRG